MKYTIKDIQPNQIVVKFENNTVFVVSIDSTSTPEEIDALVGEYDGEYFPEPDLTLNENIKVGEVRSTTFPLSLTQGSEEELENQETLDFEEEEGPYRNQFILFSALYHSMKGDTRVMDKIAESFIEEFGEIDPQEVIKAVDEISARKRVRRAQKVEAGLDPDDIFETALQELEAGE